MSDGSVRGFWINALTILIIFQLIIIDSYSLTNLDYHFYTGTNSEGKISSDQGFHGMDSAMLSIYKDKSTSKIYI